MRQIERLDTIIQNKLIEKEQWKAIALGVTASTEGERVQSSGSQQKMADAVGRFVDMEAEIDALVDELIGVKMDVIKRIEQLSMFEYNVLHKIYVQRLSMTEAADAMNKSYSWITTIHGRALANLQKLLDENCDISVSPVT
jgi:DNA-directed RNA polymerase specialized sigma subunit